MFKLALRILKKNIFKFIGLIIILMMGTALFFGLNGFRTALQNNNDYLAGDEFNQQDFEFFTLGQFSDDMHANVEDENNIVLEQQNTVDKFVYIDRDYNGGLFNAGASSVFQTNQLPIAEDSSGDENTEIEIHTKIKFSEIPDEISKLHIADGRLPENNNEVFVTDSFLRDYNFKIGDKILVDEESGIDLEIVGSGVHSMYPWVFEGSSFIKNERKYTMMYTTRDTIDDIAATTDVGVATVKYMGTFNDDLTYDERKAVYGEMLSSPTSEIQVPIQGTERFELKPGYSNIIVVEAEDIPWPEEFTEHILFDYVVDEIEPKEIMIPYTVTTASDLASVDPLAYTAGFNPVEYYELHVDTEPLQLVLNFNDYDNHLPVQLSYTMSDLYQKMTFVLYALFTGLAIFISSIILSKVLTKLRSEFGVLKAFGFTKKQMISSFMTIPVVVSIIGVIMGLLSGIVISLFYFIMLSAFMSFAVIDFEIMSQINILMGLVIPVGMFSLVGYFVLRKVFSEKAITLIQGKSEKEAKREFKLVNKIIKKRKIKTKFRVRILLSSIPRTMIVFLGIVLSALMIFVISFFMGSMHNSILSMFDVSNMDYTIVGNYEEELPDDAIENYQFPGSISDLNRINSEYDSAYEVTEDNRTFGIVVGYDPEQELIDVPFDTEDIGEGEIAVPSNIANKYNLSRGDILTFELFQTDEKEPIEMEFVVGNVFQSDFGMYLLIDEQVLFDKGYAQPGEYQAFSTNTEITREDGDEFIVLDIQGIIDSINEGLVIIYAIVAVISLVALSIMLPVMLITGGIIVDENRTNIAVMKAFGFTSKEVKSTVINVYTPIVIISGIIGFCIAYLATKVMFDAMSDFMQITVTVNWPVTIVAAIMLFVSYYISIKIAGRKINKIPVSEALKK